MAAQIDTLADCGFCSSQRGDLTGAILNREINETLVLAEGVALASVLHQMKAACGQFKDALRVLLDLDGLS